MQIKTIKFGDIDIADDKILQMPMGLPGFPGRNRFVILQREETRPFCWYQCVDDPAVALVIMDPYLFKPDYQVDMVPVLKELGWQDDGKEDLILFVVINVTDDKPRKIFANLMGPLVVNTKRHEAVQVVFHNSDYSTQHRVL